MDKRNLLHPDNPRLRRRPEIVANRPTARDGYPVDRGLQAAVDIEWLRGVCAMAKVAFPESCEPTPNYCPVLKGGHEHLGLRPGTANSEVNMLRSDHWENRCIRCGYRA